MRFVWTLTKTTEELEENDVECDKMLGAMMTIRAIYEIDTRIDYDVQVIGKQWRSDKRVSKQKDCLMTEGGGGGDRFVNLTQHQYW